MSKKPWTVIYKPDKEHRCTMPGFFAESRISSGTQIMCNTCYTRWEFVGSWEVTWRKLTVD